MEIGSGVDRGVPGGLAHLRSSAVLRRWLRETHTPVVSGPLRVQIGPVWVRTEVTYRSAVGEHGFGPILVVDEADRPVADADPVLLASACWAAARARAPRGAPIHAAGVESPADVVLRSLVTGAVDPLGGLGPDGGVRELLREGGDAPGLTRLVSGPADAVRWLETLVERDLLPALRAVGVEEDGGGDPLPPHAVGVATASLLTGRALTAIGVLGRYGVADEQVLLESLARNLRDAAREHWLPARWLSASTVTDFAVLNRSSAGDDRPPLFEAPNPLPRAVPDVAGVPVPVLGGSWSLRPVTVTDDPDGGPDVALVHRWMHAEHVASTWHQAWSPHEWHKELTGQLGGVHSLPCLVGVDGRELAYVELYRVLRDGLAGCYPFDAHDLGVHVAIGDPQAVGRGLGSTLLRVVAEGLLAADPACGRVVAEPDVHNGASVAAFGKAGFVRAGEIGLPGKNSALMVFPR